MSINIDFLKYQDQLRVKKEEGKRYLFDPIRKLWLVLQPEELVRQLVLQFLLQEKDYPRSHIKIEGGLKVNELQKRTDILVFDREVKPFLLVECKAPQVKIDEKTFWQIANYNSQYQAKYLLLTNGMLTYCCKMDYEQLQHDFLMEVPNYA